MLIAECDRLKDSMNYDNTNGFYFWPDTVGASIPAGENKCGICTNGAKLIAQKFGGYVAGYPINHDDPQTLVGAFAVGHDFAVIGDFIIDWWGWEYERSMGNPVVLRSMGIALEKYKPEMSWTVFPANDFRSR